VSDKLRGADVVVRTLVRAGVRTIFTLSGNHIMPLFDAVLGSGIRLIHTRHEAAAVHMADAYARLTGEVGVALVTGGQGHTNAVAALPTAQCAESPVLLLSGHAGVAELGRGAFQELDQADMARPVSKVSLTAQSVDGLSGDVSTAIRTAMTGRPGPVHLSLPVDLLEAKGVDFWAQATAAQSTPAGLGDGQSSAIMAAFGAARRPLVLAGPMLCTSWGRRRLAELEAATGVPAIGMESPRGINDPALGAFAEVLRQADLLVLLGKPHDFTLRFADAPHVAAVARFIVIDPESALIARAVREKGSRIALSTQTDPLEAIAALVTAARNAPVADRGWQAEVRAAIAYRPPAWAALTGKPGALHPLDICRAVQPILAVNPNAVFISDGGEVGQWAQAGISHPRRIINGVAGSIGSALPFAIAARVVEPDAPVIAVSGDGAIGFHIAEIDTAVRSDLPFVMIVGNDARWNAEHQIQLREYGAPRAHACTLLPTRYDQVATAFGGHGEHVSNAADFAPALAHAIASRRPAIVNVTIEGHAAPIVRRPT
jgi:acetolactate synthase-1/2/3 large subunit